MVHEDDTYALSELGKDAYSLMNKLASYSTSAAVLGVLTKKSGFAIIANAMLWAIALMAVVIIEEPLNFMTILVFIGLISICNIILFSMTTFVQLMTSDQPSVHSQK